MYLYRQYFAPKQNCFMVVTMTKSFYARGKTPVRPLFRNTKWNLKNFEFVKMLATKRNFVDWVFNQETITVEDKVVVYASAFVTQSLQIRPSIASN